MMCRKRPVRNGRPKPGILGCGLASSGYTLIELLLYIAMIGALLTGVTMFFGTTLDARVKNQSISEVDQQGAQIMELITQTIRNADSVTTPAAGASGSTLTLAVPTPAASPTIFNMNGTTTVLGYNSDGTSTDSNNSDSINATKFTATGSGTVSTLYARVGATIGANPNNKAQMAIYSGATPTTLLATSSEVTLTANTWNAFPISPVTINNGTTYWLAYNTNGTTGTQNNLRVHTGTAGQSLFTDHAYGTWPASWSGTAQALEFSVYADVVAGGGSNAIQIKEGSGSEVLLSNSKVQVSGLTFTNLTRPSTPGVIRVSFTISRLNASNRNEYDYQKTFVTSAALRWP